MKLKFGYNSNFDIPGPVMLALIFLTLGFLVLPLDVYVAKFFLTGVIPGDVRAIFAKAEVFGHAYGIFAICFTVFLLDQSNRKNIPRLVIYSLCAGLSADLVKLFFWRIRPHECDLTGTFWDTFNGSIFTVQQIDLAAMIDSSQHSLPSAHTAVAVAFAIMLGRIYPKAKYWFLFLSLLCAINRVDGGAHFASDTLWGASIGCATVCLIPEVLRIHGYQRTPARKPVSDCSFSGA